MLILVEGTATGTAEELASAPGGGSSSSDPLPDSPKVSCPLCKKLILATEMRNHMGGHILLEPDWMSKYKDKNNEPIQPPQPCVCAA